MNLFTTIRRAMGLQPEKRGTPHPADDFWYQPVPGRSGSGRTVSPETALRLSAVYGSIRVLSDDNAAQPIHVIEDGPGGRRRVRDHWLYDLLRYEPNPNMSATDFRRALITCRFLRGNAYAYIETDNVGRVRGLHLMDPDMVTPKLDDRDRLVYQVYRESNRARPQEVIPQDRILHFKGVSRDGLVGISPIAAAVNSLSIGLSADEHSEATLQGLGQRLVFETDEHLSSEARDALSEDYHRKYAGPKNAWKAPFLVSGLKARPVSVSPVDLQLLETSRFNGAQIAQSIFGVPPFRVGLVESTDTFASLAAHQLSYAIYTMLPLNVCIEQEIMRKLLTREDRKHLAIEHLMDGLLRADPKTQAEILATGIEHGRYTLDDVRDLDNRSRFGGLAAEPLVSGKLSFMSERGQEAGAGRVASSRLDDEGAK